MVIFHSYVELPEGKSSILLWFCYGFPTFPPGSPFFLAEDGGEHAPRSGVEGAEGDLPQPAWGTGHPANRLWGFGGARWWNLQG